VIRRFLLFLFASAILGAGLYLLWLDLTHARVIFSRLVFAGLFLSLFGGYLLWDDFIRPLTGRWKNPVAKLRE
jgi:hypothetical protein